MTNNTSHIKTTPWTQFVSLVLIYSPTQLRTNAGGFSYFLDSGVFSLLLDHGADPDASVDSDPPFWIGWLSQIFYLVDLWKHCDPFLRVLKTFFESGVDLKQMHSLKVDRFTFAWKYSSWTWFGKKLRELSVVHGSGSTLSRPRLQFLLQVHVELAKETKGEDKSWDEIMPSLRSLFSNLQLREILQARGKIADHETPELRKRYMVPDPEASCSRDLKKRKAMEG